MSTVAEADLKRLEYLITGLSQRIEQRFDAVESRLERVEVKVQDLTVAVAVLDSKVDGLDKRIDSVDNRSQYNYLWDFQRCWRFRYRNLRNYGQDCLFP